MKKINKITSTAIPLRMRDVDTDMIIPAQMLTKVSASGYGQYAFSHLKKNDINCVFNNEKYKKSKILISLSSFGCGSSREHAVWAILESGIEAIIASSFSDIFYSNAGKNGLLLITLPENIILSLIDYAEKETLSLTIDLNAQRIRNENESQTYSFDFDPFRKQCFIKGHDDMDFLLENTDKINRYYKSRDI